MSERYSKIFTSDECLYTEGAPIVISARALLKDNETGALLAQLKLHSIMGKMTKLVKVEVSAIDTMGRACGAPIQHEYLDLKVSRGENFGTKSPIKIPNSATRSFTVRITEVGFADGSIWTDAGKEWTAFPKQAPIESLITDENALFVYKSTFGSEAKFVHLAHKDKWICTCGKINDAREKHCYSCEAAKAELESIDPEELRKEGIYLKALALIKENNLNSLSSAKTLLEGIIGYKNSEVLVNEIPQKIESASKKKKKTIIIASITSCAALVIGLLSYFVAYPFISMAGGDYLTYINMYNTEEFEIPDGTTEIGDSAFENSKIITSVIIPDSVTSIGSKAFCDCSNLTSVTIGSGVKSIYNQAFYGCKSLKSITIPSGVTSIGEYAFAGCTSLTSITIPNSVTSIGEHAFRDCTNLKSITIGSGVKTISRWMFSNCRSLTSVTIGDSVTSIGSYAFQSCASLTSITIPNSVTSIGDRAFQSCASLTGIVIPDSVTSIGSGAFQNCFNLTSITIPFVGATKNGTEKTHFGYIFGASSYSNNDDYVPRTLKTVIITGGNSIGDYAFYYCDSLTSVTIPDSVTSIGDRAFSACDSLTSITVDENNPAYKSIDGNLYTKDGKTLIQYAAGKTDTSFAIPSGVTTIGEEAFRDCTNLTSVTIGNSVTTIGEDAFYNCDSLTSVVIPDSVTSIGYSAFFGCDSLTSITLPFVGATKNGTKDTHFGYIFGASSYSSNDYLVPDTLKTVIITGGNSIGDYAFYNCDSLTSVTIGNGVTTIGNSAFEHCSCITSLTIGNSVTSIGNSAFEYCIRLTNVTIGNSVTTIGESAFYGCDSLTSVTIPDSVTSIGDRAFMDCDSLTSVTIGNGVTSIGEYAFYRCDDPHIKYRGTQAQWNAISKGYRWHSWLGDYTITYDYDGE